jgi:hypothetical protein
MTKQLKETFIVVVIGDVHGRIELALRGLRELEQDLGRSIDQVFSVGDFGLFLREEDWKWLTGPSRHQHPDWSPRIRAAWEEWPWPLSMIGGNHEPYLRLRVLDQACFGPKLSYTNAGVLPHSIPGLRVCGLSGIYHPQFLAYSTNEDLRPLAGRRLNSWSQVVDAVQHRHLSAKRLTYYKEEEVDEMKNLPPQPHLLLLHDWPKAPEFTKFRYDRRPEAEIVSALRPQMVCCGHHHRADTFDHDGATVYALNIIARDYGHGINPGWALPLEWNAATHSLQPFASWPRMSPLPNL